MFKRRKSSYDAQLCDHNRSEMFLALLLLFFFIGKRILYSIKVYTMYIYIKTNRGEYTQKALHPKVSLTNPQNLSKK